MTNGFYEQLGVTTRATTDEVRVGYTAALAALTRRRREVVDQGGDPDAVDRARRQLDEAWEVLSSPARRRRYDAMRALQGVTLRGEDDLWQRVSGALIPPDTAAAVDLLRVTTSLPVGRLADAPGASSPAPRRLEEDFPAASQEVTVAGTTPTYVPATEIDVEPELERSEPAGAPPQRAPLKAPPAIQAGPPALKAVAPSIQPGPTAIQAAPPSLKPAAPSLRVVDSSSAVVLLTPSAPKAPAALSSEEIGRLVQRYGNSGALLQAAREARGMSLAELADATRISDRYLQAIERDDIDALPSATFVRGYLREVCRRLGLDDSEVVAGYLSRFSS